MTCPEDTEYRNNYRRPTICDRMVFQDAAGVASNRSRYDPVTGDAPPRYERRHGRGDNAPGDRRSPRDQYAPGYEYPRPKSRNPYSPNILALIRDWEDWAEQVGTEDSPPPMHHVHNPELRRLLEAGRSGIQALQERVYKDATESRPSSASPRAKRRERETRADDASVDAHRNDERSVDEDDAESPPTRPNIKERSSAESDRRRDRRDVRSRNDDNGSSSSSTKGRGEGRRAKRRSFARAERPLLRVYLSDSEDDGDDYHRPLPQKNRLFEKSNVLRDVNDALSSSKRRRDQREGLEDDDRSPKYIASARKYDDGPDGPYYIASARRYNRDDAPVFGSRRDDRSPRRGYVRSPRRGYERSPRYYEDGDDEGYDDDYGHRRERRYVDGGGATTLQLECENKFLKQELCNVRWEMSRFRKKCEEILADQQCSYGREMERLRGSMSERNLRFQSSGGHQVDGDTNNRMRRRLEQHILSLGRSWNEDMYENVAERGFNCERPFVDPLDFEKRINKLRVIDA
eukprot:GEMP01027408.1.p1 GENE.GEMP01027408.1~~GEMP01027408.1.p1  ORF type:complete len:517 (+),score=107.92 GEMP01027408.1:246-1796(+)